MNPEFRRQLWLQFSPTRLVLLPVLLLAIFAAVFLSAQGDPARYLAVTGATLFAVLVLGLGTLAAGASVMDEITDRTWDQQRMSAMQPWAMTWGKLAGATAYGWYGGAWCLLLAIPSALLDQPHERVLRLTQVGLLTGVFLQASLLGVNLQLAKVGGRMARRGGVWTLLLLLLWGLGPLLGLLRDPGINWWGLSFNRLDFAVASMALLAFCAVIGAWRSMAEVLTVRQLPWAWPALALLVTVYLTGFTPTHRLAVFGMMGLGSCVVFTYFSILTEPQPRPLWQRVAARLCDGQWRAALLQLPRWPTTLLLALPFAALASVTLGTASLLPWAGADEFSQHALSVVLLLTRDCALALFLAFSARGRRPVMGFVVLMGVLYGLLPWLLGMDRNRFLTGLVQPLMAPGSLSVIFAMLHAGVALGLLRWRWQAATPG